MKRDKIKLFVKFFEISFLLSITNRLNAQNQQTYFWEQVHFGGGIGLSFGDGFLAVRWRQVQSINLTVSLRQELALTEPTIALKTLIIVRYWVVVFWDFIIRSLKYSYLSNSKNST